ncbi:MAG: Flp family type IVb pilin [Geminicoccaceae bacterium]
MSHLAMLLQQFSEDESGAALVEYAVIFAVLIAGTVTALGLIAPQLVNIFGVVETALTGIAALLP